MPKYNHANLGDVVSRRYRDATIKKLFYPTSDFSEEKWDCALVELMDGSQGGEIPIFYHCQSGVRSSLRENGAVANAAYAFQVDDQVIVMMEVYPDREEIVHVVGFTDGARPCKCCFGDFNPNDITSWDDMGDIVDPPECRSLEALRLALTERGAIVDYDESYRPIPSSVYPYLTPDQRSDWVYSVNRCFWEGWSSDGIIEQYVDHTVNDGDFTGLDSIPMWAYQGLLDYLAEERESVTSCAQMSNWILQTKAMINLLKWTRGEHADVTIRREERRGDCWVEVPSDEMGYEELYNANKHLITSTWANATWTSGRTTETDYESYGDIYMGSGNGKRYFSCRLIRNAIHASVSVDDGVVVDVYLREPYRISGDAGLYNRLIKKGNVGAGEEVPVLDRNSDHPISSIPAEYDDLSRHWIYTGSGSVAGYYYMSTWEHKFPSNEFPFFSNHVQTVLRNENRFNFIE